MQRGILVVICAFVILVIIAGCLSVSLKKSDVQSTLSPTLTETQKIIVTRIPIDTSAITRVKLVAKYENRDAGDEDDGVALYLSLSDNTDKSVLAGTRLDFPLDIEVWTFLITAEGGLTNTRDRKIFSKSETLEKVDLQTTTYATRVSGNKKLYIGFDELKGKIPSTYGFTDRLYAVKVHLPDGRTLEASCRKGI